MRMSLLKLLFIQELFKRAENREQLKKRFEIQKKLRIQQKLKSTLTPKKRKSISDEEEGTATKKEADKDDKGKCLLNGVIQKSPPPLYLMVCVSYCCYL